VLFGYVLSLSLAFSLQPTHPLSLFTHIKTNKAGESDHQAEAGRK